MALCGMGARQGWAEPTSQPATWKGLQGGGHQGDLMGRLLDISLVVREQALRELVAQGEGGRIFLPRLLDKLSTGDLLERRAAQRALLRMGALALPSVMKLLSSADREQRFHAQSLLPHFGALALPSLRLAYREGDATMKERILRIYVEMKPEAEPALSEVFALYLRSISPKEDTSQRLLEATEAVLLAHPKPAVGLLMRALGEGIDSRREALLSLLGRMGEAAFPTLNQLLRLLEEVAPPARISVVRVIGQIGLPAKAAAPALISQIREDEPSLALQSVIALGQLRSHPAQTLPALEKALHYKDLPVRLAAAHAIGRFSRQEIVKSLPALREALRREDPVLHAAICQTLAVAQEDAAPALPEILPLLPKGSRETRRLAIRAIGAMKARAAEAIKPLLQLFTEDDASLREEASLAIAQIGEPALAPLIATLRTRRNLMQFLMMRRSRKRNQAARALGHLGAKAAPALAALQWAITKPDTRQQAIWALGQIGAAARPTLSAILSYAQDSDPAIRAAVIEAIGKIGQQDQSILALLRESLQAADTRIRLQAIHAAAHLSPQSSSLLPSLMSRLRYKSDRKAVHQAIARFGAVALPSLQAALAHPEWSMRLEALDALEAMPAIAVAILPSILPLLRDSDYRVRASCARILGRFPQHTKIILPLLKAQRRDPVPYVQQHVQQAIHALEHAHESKP